MAVSPPYVIDETLPQTNNLLSQYPGQSQPFRDTIESWLSQLSDPTTGLMRATAFPNPFLVTLSNDAATEGPTLTLNRISASPAANDLIGAIHFQGKDSTAVDTDYGRVIATIDDPVNGSEDSSIFIQPIFNNVIQGGLRVQSNVGATLTGVLTSTSDRWLKDNIEVLDLSKALVAMNSIYGYSYNWKSNGLPDLGFVAQEVLPHFPELVRKDEQTGDLSLNYHGMIAVLWEIVKSQQARLDALEAR